MLSLLVNSLFQLQHVMTMCDYVTQGCQVCVPIVSKASPISRICMPYTMVFDFSHLLRRYPRGASVAPQPLSHAHVQKQHVAVSFPICSSSQLRTLTPSEFEPFHHHFCQILPRYEEECSRCGLLLQFSPRSPITGWSPWHDRIRQRYAEACILRHSLNWLQHLLLSGSAVYFHDLSWPPRGVLYSHLYP